MPSHKAEFPHEVAPEKSSHVGCFCRGYTTGCISPAKATGGSIKLLGKNMKLVISILLIGFATYSHAQHGLTPEQKTVLELTGSMSARKFSIGTVQKLAADNPKEIITLLREIEAGRNDIGTYSVFATNARVALLKLNDRPTIDKIIPCFFQYGSGRLDEYSQDMADSTQPYLIPVLAVHLFLPASSYDAYERERVQHLSDVLSDSPVFLADTLIILIVRDSDQFCDQTRAWAGTMWQNCTNKDQIRNILRVWWKENEKLIRGGELRSVKPGSPPTKVQQNAPANISQRGSFENTNHD